MFEIPHYTTKLLWLGELHPTTTEAYMARRNKERGIESLAIELIEDRVIAHVDAVVEAN